MFWRQQQLTTQSTSKINHQNIAITLDDEIGLSQKSHLQLHSLLLFPNIRVIITNVHVIVIIIMSLMLTLWCLAELIQMLRNGQS